MLQALLHAKLPSKLHPWRTTVVLATASFAAISMADDTVYRLDDVVVTASRTAQTVDDTLAPVTVISREQIERSQATSVTELIALAPGTQITYSGGPGSKTGVYLRGTRTSQTLVLIDGIKANSASSGESPLQYLDPDQVEKIEIVRGPRSSIYGADAVGGVINVITKKGSGKPHLTIKAGGGSRKTGEYGINLSGDHEGTRFNLGARLYETSGYDRTTNKQGSDWDDDAYRNKSFSGSLSHTFGNDIEIGSNLFYSKGKSEFDNGYNFDGSGSTHPGYPIEFFEQTGINSHISVPINDGWLTRLEAGYVKDQRDNIGSAYPGNGTNERVSASWINDIGWSENQLLTSGLDYTNDKYEGTSAYSIEERYNVGLFAQNQSTFDNSDLQVAGRFDKNEQYGEKVTGNISWGIQLPKTMRLVTSYGTAFRAPTFMDLYSPNPVLKPETSRNAEIELRGVVAKSMNWSVNLFQNDMDNMLEYDFGTGNMENIAKARIRGIEFVLDAKVDDWDVISSLSFIDPENRSGADEGKTLYRRAKQLLSITADKSFGRWSLGGTFRAQGESWNDPANTERVAGFGTFDLRASVDVTKELKTQFKVVNLLDKEYTTTQGYIDEPRGVFATLVWTPDI